MPGESVSCVRQGSDTTILLLELAVPLLSFGGALLAIFAIDSGSTLDIRYFAAGCVISSCILAWLAWIRPVKDIVALSTPIYAIIFFIVPTNLAVTLILEMLYAASLTILLVRLKLRFGPARLKGPCGEAALATPLMTYCESLRGKVPVVGQSAAHLAAIGFIRFSLGDYREVIHAADTATQKNELLTQCPALYTAFEIIREQAELLETSAEQPDEFRDFPPSDRDCLAKQVPEKKRTGRYELALENALLLLFATAWIASESDRPMLLSGEEFALRLIAE